MLGKISNTWALMGNSWQLLKQDKELLLFTLISGICCLAIVASFLIPMIHNARCSLPTADKTNQFETAEQVAFYAKLFLFYFCNYLVIIFFNSAIIGCVAMRMQGDNPTLADGFRISFSRMPMIVGWSLIAATVGFILRIIENKNKTIGRLVAGLLGIAWTMVSFLVLPVMVIENKGPFTALKESTAMLKQTWGQQIIGNFSFAVIFFLLFMPVVLVIFLLAMLQNSVLIVTCIILGVVYFITLLLIQSTLQVIFQTALYYYVKNGTAPAGFDSAILGRVIGQ